MPAFTRTIGIDYSDAETPISGLNGFRVYLGEGASPLAEVGPPLRSARMYWSGAGDGMARGGLNGLRMIAWVRVIRGRDASSARPRQA